MTYSSARLRFMVSLGMTGCLGVSVFLLSVNLDDVSLLADETSTLENEKEEKVGEMEVKGNALMVGEGVSRVRLAKVGEATKKDGVLGREGVPRVPNRPVFDCTLRFLSLASLVGSEAVGVKDMSSPGLTGSSSALKLSALLMMQRIAAGTDRHL